MEVPAPALAPVIPPFMVPIVQEYALGTEDVNAIFGLDPLHTIAVFGVVIMGAG